ncbi:hypothetical protein [Aliagarivorans marinus]|uniref:hypothetical protein n=1 Tax=Aliagarivorans marinus TaxID=561965 RepID=UPI0004794825|nr:hypothetical protein [Aliagarivorans marinus]
MAKRIAKINRLSTWLMVAMLVLPSIAYPCRFHSGSESADGPILPGSSDIILQSHLAQQTGEMTPLAPLSGMRGYRRAAWWLTLLSRRLEALGLADLHIVIVDAQMWSQMSSRHQQSVLLDIEAPIDRANTVMLSEAALAALVNQSLSFEQAMNLRVMQVYRDELGIREQLTNESGLDTHNSNQLG